MATKSLYLNKVERNQEQGSKPSMEAAPFDFTPLLPVSRIQREGRTFTTCGLASGPQGYRPLREFLSAKLKRDEGQRMNSEPDVVRA
jgi:hypothetical protein